MTLFLGNDACIYFSEIDSMSMLIHFAHSFFSSSLLESSHGGSYVMHQGMTPLDQQYQYFGALNFPVTEEAEAWKEKAS